MQARASSIAPAIELPRLNAASAIGDDRLQKRTQGQVVPDSFTHGSSAQRVRWFRIGFDSGEAGRCDTFEAARL